jgi:enoyl-CoA hydratase
VTSYETIHVEQRERVALVTIDRPKALNALSLQVMQELTDATARLDGDPGTGCIVITGSERAFAAGADIKEMQAQSYSDMYLADWFGGWDALTRVRTPLVAAVAGYALGGGCELAMCADFRVSGESTKWGQPEILLGIIPGAGGTQRLPRLVGPAKAKEIILSGRFVEAAEALAIGLVDKVVPDAEVYEASLAWARTFVNGPAHAIRAA